MPHAADNIIGSPRPVDLSDDGLLRLVLAPLSAEGFVADYWRVRPLRIDRIGDADRFSALLEETSRRRVPPLLALARSLQARLPVRACAEVRTTPAGERSGATDGDLVDTIVLQVHGSCRWELFDAGARPGRFAPAQSLLLRAGGTLYVPRGTPWRSRAVDGSTRVQVSTV